MGNKLGEYAAKVLQDLHSDESALRHFAKELGILSTLKHPHVVTAVGYDDSPSVILYMDYVVFDWSDYVDGDTIVTYDLGGFLKQLNKFPTGAQLFQENMDLFSRVAYETSSGLKYLHQQDIVHRDLKPGNILIGNNQTTPFLCKITDFGEARAHFSQTLMALSNIGHLHRGTQPYMAPEIVPWATGGITTPGITSSNPDDLKRVDIWALGMVFFILLNPDLEHPYQHSMRAGTLAASDVVTVMKEIMGSQGLPLQSGQHPDLKLKCQLLQQAMLACLRYNPHARVAAEDVSNMFRNSKPDWLSQPTADIGVGDYLSPCPVPAPRKKPTTTVMKPVISARGSARCDHSWPSGPAPPIPDKTKRPNIYEYIRTMDLTPASALGTPPVTYSAVTEHIELRGFRLGKTVINDREIKDAIESYMKIRNVINVFFRADLGKAFVQLRDEKGISILKDLSEKRQLLIKGQSLEIFRLEKAYEGLTCGVEVFGLPDDMTEPQITTFFQRLIGAKSGKIEEVSMIKDSRSAILTMETIDGARKICDTPNIAVAEDSVSTFMLLGVSPPVLISRPHDKEKILFRDLPDAFDEKQLKRLLQKITKLRVVDVIYGQNKGACLVEFDNIPDLSTMWDHFSLKPFECKMIGINRVELAGRIEVHHIKDMSHSKLEASFKSYLVDDISYKGGVAIVSPRSAQDLCKIMKNKNNIFADEQDVFLHYPEIGLRCIEERKPIVPREIPIPPAKTSTKEVPMTLAECKVLKLAFDNDLKQLESSSAEGKIKITVHQDSNTVRIAGAEEHVLVAVKEIYQWLITMKMQEFPLDDSTMSKCFDGVIGESFISAKEHEHKVAIEAIKQPRKIAATDAPEPGSRPRVDRESIGGRKTRNQGNFSAVGSGKLKHKNGTLVTMCVVEIQTVQADVIVNSSQRDMDLSIGAMSRALHVAAGPDMQREASALAPLALGEVKVTKGYKLPCSLVYHVICPQWDHRKKQCIQLYRKMVESCLGLASAGGHSSIAFPTIGAGGIGLPSKVVTENMFGTVERFLDKSPSTTLKDIKFVVFHKDTSLQQGFQSEFASTQAPAFKDPGTVSRATLRKDVKPKTVISSADFQLSGLRIRIKPMLLKDATTHGILSFVSQDITKFYGDDGNSVREIGGDMLERELKSAKLSKSKTTIVFAGGRLPSVTYLILAKCTKKDWVSRITAALTTADNKGLTSVAIGMLANESGRLPTTDMASYTIKSIARFAENNQNMEEVLIIVPENESNMVNVYATVLAELKLVQKAGSEKQNSSTDSGDMEISKFKILGKEQQAVNAVVKDIKAFCSSATCTKEINDYINQVKAMNYAEKQDLVSLAARCGANLEIINGVIKVRGVEREVFHAIDDLRQHLRILEKEDMYGDQELLLVGKVQWGYEDSAGGERMDFENSINAKLETSYLRGLKQTSLDMNGTELSADFQEWMCNFAGMKMVLIRSDLKETVVKPESLPLPTAWSIMAPSNDLETNDLSPSDTEYQDVETQIKSSCGSKVPTIQKICRIQNPGLYRRYCAQKKDMDMRNNGLINERLLWHGTAEDAFSSINRYGFNRSYCGKNATAYGQGVYFATGFPYSAQDLYSPPNKAGEKHMYLCRVATGFHTAGKSDMRHLPARKGGLLYDSAVNDKKTPAMFIIFSDNQAYPEYIITFKL